MDDQKQQTPADVSHVARDAHERAAGFRPEATAGQAGGAKLRTARNAKKTPPADLKAMRERMEQSILDKRKAELHCGTCGAQGRWRTESVKKPKRYLVCTGCGIIPRSGYVQIAVTAEEVDAALGL